jgi:hypothetical protein
MSKISDIQKWRLEIETAEKSRDEEFGKYEKNDKSGAGEIVDYFEKGFFSECDAEDIMLTTLNIVDSIVSIIPPSLYFKNPKTLCTPDKIESEDTAPLAARIIDYYRKRIEAERTNKNIIWDAYTLGYGAYKTGYVTKFGKDIADKDKKPLTFKDKIEKGLQSVGLKKKEEEVIHPDLDRRIIAESPFLEYISPFKFLKDPRSKTLNDAMWWGHEIRKTVAYMKKNKKYKDTSDLKGSDPEEVGDFAFEKLTQSVIEEFQTLSLYEIHYRNDDEDYLMYISKDKDGEFREHYNDKSIYEMDEWQADQLFLKRNPHKQYPKSDMVKIKKLQDRITSTIDAILEQVDRFTPKIAYEESGVTPQGKKSLKEGGIGSLVACNKAPGEVFKELNFTQLKADLAKLLDQIVSLVSIQTGLTRAQLTGVSDSGSATEATIEQGGQNIRLSDMHEDVRAFVNRQSRKLWKVVTQFVELDELELINGVKGIDPQNGLPKYNWLTISSGQRKRLVNGQYDFDIETGSTEKINLAVVRKAFENWFNILARTEVLALMQSQGWKFDLGEFAKKGMDAFPELGVDSSKVIQPITEETKGLIPPEMAMPKQGGTTSGSNVNELRSQQAESTPNIAQQVNEAY